MTMAMTVDHLTESSDDGERRSKRKHSVSESVPKRISLLKNHGKRSTPPKSSPDTSSSASTPATPALAPGVDYKPSGLLQADNAQRFASSYTEPEDACLGEYRLYTFEQHDNIRDTIILKKPKSTVGSDAQSDITVGDESVLKAHAVLQIRPMGVCLYDFSGKSFINNKAVQPGKFVVLKDKDTVRFGDSEKEFLLVAEAA